MDTNTIMLIALAVLIILSAVGIWLANRGSGVTRADEVLHDEHYEEERDTKVAD